MIKILDLCAGTQSVKKAFPDCDYRGVDIYSPEGENLILDLTEDNVIEKLEELLDGWKPDFIWASPLCTTFSRATCIKGGTLSYELIDEKVYLRRDFSQITHKAYVKHKDNVEWQEEQIRKGIMGLRIMWSVMDIIAHYSVPFAIENPSGALSKYVLKDYKRTVTNYCMYGFDYKKSTAIYGHKEYDLLKCNHKKHAKVMSGHKSKTGIENAPSSNKDRSRVPEELIRSIINQAVGQ